MNDQCELTIPDNPPNDKPPIATLDSALMAIRAVRWRRITKRQAQKLFGEGVKSIFLCPHKMRPDGPWSPAAMVFGREYLERAAWYNPATNGGRVSDLWHGTLAATAWALMYNNWAYYNATHEVRYYAHYYVQE